MTILKIIISDTVLLSIIGSATTLLTLYINHRLGVIHKQINSRMDELLKLNRSEAAAAGKAEGKAEEKAETIQKTEAVVIQTPIIKETKIEGKIEGVIKPNIKKE